MNSISERVKELRYQINHWNQQYYLHDHPIVDDAIYDRAFRELRELEEKFPEYMDSNSPTQRVGSKPLDKFNKIQHENPMLSLDNAMDEDAIRSFDKRVRKDLGLSYSNMIQYQCEPKFDGLSIELIYENGVLIVGSTRGDGEIGEDITQNIKTIKSIPLKISDSKASFSRERFCVRGEIYLEKDELERLNKERIANNEKPFANCRNAAAGSLRQLDSRETAKRKLKVMFYQIDFWNYPINYQSHIVDTIDYLGFPCVNKNVWNSIDEVIEEYKRFEAIRYNLPYDIDGMVIKINFIDYQLKLGNTGHHPRHSIAAKFDPIQAITIIRDITIQVGRTGQLTPVAELEPIGIGGVIVSRATLHNEDQIKAKDIRVGDKIVIRRAGEVIPEVVKVIIDFKVPRSPAFAFPDNCPVCNHPVSKSPSEAAYYCLNEGCLGRLQGRLEHFVSRDCMDIEGMGGETIALLIDKGFIKDIPDIYELMYKDLAYLPGFGARSAKNLLDAIEKSKNPPLWKFINSLGIRQVGKGTAKRLAKHYKNVDDFIKNATYNDLIPIDDIGPETATSIEIWLDTNLDLIDKLFDSGIEPTSELLIMPTVISPFSGKTVVITGSFEDKREILQEWLISQGAICTGSVSKKTDLLIVGQSAGSKLDKAKKLGIQIMEEDDFYILYKGE